MSRRPQSFTLGAIAGLGLLVMPLGPVPAPLAQFGIGSTAATAQGAQLCRLIYVGGRALYHCARAGYRVWSHPAVVRATGILGVGAAGTIGNRPRPAHAPGFHGGGRLHGYAGPRFSPHQINQMRYYAHRNQVLGNRHGAVQMPRAHPGYSMSAYRGSYRRRW